MNLYDLTVPQLKKMLTNLDKWIDKGVEHAKKKSFDPNVLCTLRLAPDMYDFTKQVQSACDNAKFVCARLTAKEPPKHPDDEKTIEELKARIAKVVAYLDTFKPSDFDGVEKRMVSVPWMPGKGLVGSEYLVALNLPNFYFHVTTAYDILRHAGVEIGKTDFIGGLDFKDV